MKRGSTISPTSESRYPKGEMAILDHRTSTINHTDRSFFRQHLRRLFARVLGRFGSGPRVSWRRVDFLSPSRGGKIAKSSASVQAIATKSFSIRRTVYRRTYCTHTRETDVCESTRQHSTYTPGTYVHTYAQR